ncbi:uncharacterized protein LOC119682614 isoform X3 [Teleopsis dalmanni]|uniref:uncharacterized protein LOC119682614 isoform X3 n=1 Tax=Teleopsis dalmanni TaxID=139649 RepID=UPI0018CFDF06|nr:uncharacterized protein LOC119682614 isoform X3 [Teleopsis dalmanni]
MDDQKFWSAFIELYEQLPCLWKVKSMEYTDKVLKSEAYSNLVDFLQSKYTDADRDFVIRKINNIRTNYRRELNKVRERPATGNTPAYVPTLWYFKKLHFLADQEESCKGWSSLESEKTMNNLSPPSKKKKTREDKMSTYEEDEPIQLAVTKLQENATDNDPLAKSWAMQYNEMNSRQKTLARKIISDVLFHGCMGNLEMSHAMKIQSIFLQPAVRPNMEETTDSFEVTYLTDMKSPIDY